MDRFQFAGKDSQQWSWVNADKTIMENKKYGNRFVIIDWGIK